MSAAQTRQNGGEIKERKEGGKSKRLSKKPSMVTRLQKKRVYDQIIVFSDNDDGGANSKYTAKDVSTQPISSDGGDIVSPPPRTLY